MAIRTPDPDGVEEVRDGVRWRRCVACGQVLPETHLVRFVAGPDASLVPDLAADLPGRGVWVEATRASLEAALKKGAFARSLKAGVKADGQMPDLVADLLQRRIRAQLGLARKSGALVTGFEKVREALRAARATLLVEASDGAPDGRTKVFSLAAKAVPGLGVAGALSTSHLGLALGLDNVVHATLTSEAHTRRLAREMLRLSGFTPIMPADWELPDGLVPVEMTPLAV